MFINEDFKLMIGMVWHIIMSEKMRLMNYDIFKDQAAAAGRGLTEVEVTPVG